MDKNYLFLLQNLIDNVKYFSKKAFPVFHVIYSQELVYKIRDSFKNDGYDVKLYPVDEEILTKFPISGHVSLATYYRLLIGELIPEKITKALYLDLDILVQADLSNLLTIELPGKAVVAATKNNNHLEDVIRLNLKGSWYFNAGVMLIDLARWRSMDVYNKAIMLVNSNRIKIVWWDQDILNCIFDGNVYEIQSKWNHQLSAFKNQKWFKYISAKPSIIHFTGSGKRNKPWYFDCENIYGYKYRYLTKRLSGFIGIGNETKKRKLRRLLLDPIFKTGII